MIKIIFCFCILQFSIASFAADKKIIPISGKLPIEMALIFKSIQFNEISNDDYKTLLNYAYSLESYAKRVSKEELFFTIKSEIYKAILKNSPSTKQSFTVDDTKNLKKAIKNSKDPFIKWLLMSLDSDSQLIFNSAQYKQYLIQKNVGTFLSNETKKISKKIQLISKIFFRINPDNPDFLQDNLNQFFSESMRNISESLFLIASETKFEKLLPIEKEDTPLSYFNLESIKIIPDKTAKKAKSVEEILMDSPETLDQESTALPSSKTVLPEPVNTDWIEDSSSPINIKKLPKPSNDADWLQDI